MNERHALEHQILANCKADSKGRNVGYYCTGCLKQVIIFNQNWRKPKGKTLCDAMQYKYLEKNNLL